MPPKEATTDLVSESTLKELFEEYTSDLKKHFAEQVAILNNEIAASKSELQSRDTAITDLTTEVAVVKSVNEELVSINKALEEKSRFSKNFSRLLSSRFNNQKRG